MPEESKVAGTSSEPSALANLFVSFLLKSKQRREIAQAIYNYEATEPNELSFHAGDTIVVLLQVGALFFLSHIFKDDSGWWQGSLNGISGWFPSNFVSQRTISSEDPFAVIAFQLDRA